MVTVGRDLTIRRLTPAATKPFNLVASDLGRSLEHIKFDLQIDSLGDAIRHVVATGRTVGQRSARQPRPLVAGAREAVPDQRRRASMAPSSSRSKST